MGTENSSDQEDFMVISKCPNWCNYSQHNEDVRQSWGSTGDILIHSRSPHNFLNSKFAQNLKLPVQDNNGRRYWLRMQTRCVVWASMWVSHWNKCVGVTLELPGHNTILNFFVLQMEEFDIVLGIQWLKMLGSIIWNFESFKCHLPLQISCVTRDNFLILSRSGNMDY